MPKTTSQPTASSERTRDWAPVAGEGSTRAGRGAAGRVAGCAAWSCCSVGTPERGAGRGLAVVIGDQPLGVPVRVCERAPDTKKPSPPGGGEGRRVSELEQRARGSSGADAPGEYENSLHGRTVARPVPHPVTVP